MVKSRKKQSAKNIGFALTNHLVRTILVFATRYFLIIKLGEMYAGINSFFLNVISILSLAELGFGAALVYSMYKPMADNDTEKLKTLTALYKKIYMLVGLVITILGLCLLPFIPLLIADYSSIPKYISLQTIFIVFLAQSVSSYFMAHRRALIFAAQRNDIESIVSLGTGILYNGLQIATLVLFANFYVYVTVAAFTTILDNAVIYIISCKKFPHINNKNITPLPTDERKKIQKNVIAMLCHKLGGVVTGASTNLIVSAMLGVIILGRYSNYLVITVAMFGIIGVLLHSIRGSVGNLVSKRDKDYVYTLFKRLNFAYVMFVSFCTICMISLFQPFISVWLGADRLLTTQVMILIGTSFFLTNVRRMTDLFKETTGLFWNDRWKPVAEVILNIGISITLCYFFGLAGAILGAIISITLTVIWVEPFVLYRNYFKKSLWKYFSRFTIYVLVTVITGAIVLYTTSLLPTGGFWNLILTFTVTGALTGILLALSLCWTREFRFWLREVTGFVKKLLSRGKNKDTIDKATTQKETTT
jgi:O-antigen/teichoic acid export membrane protein